MNLRNLIPALAQEAAAALERALELDNIHVAQFGQNAIAFSPATRKLACVEVTEQPFLLSDPYRIDGCTSNHIVSALSDRMGFEGARIPWGGGNGCEACRVQSFDNTRARGVGLLRFRPGAVF